MEQSSAFSVIEPEHPSLSVARQCDLASISRSSFYYQPAGERAENLGLMRLIDAQFLETRRSGSRQMARHFRRDGHEVGRKLAETRRVCGCVRRLMAVMGLAPIYQRPRTTVPNPAKPLGLRREHRVWPYLLRGVVIDWPNQVWCTGLTLYLIGVAGHSWNTRPGQPGSDLRLVACSVDGAPGLTHAPWTRSDGSQGPLRVSLYEQG